MAKKSAIQKNLRRIKLVKKYAKKRAALKKIINNKKQKRVKAMKIQQVQQNLWTKKMQKK